MQATGFSQKILVVENIRSMKNIKYYQGDDIILKVENRKDRIHDEIYDMDDTTLSLVIAGTVRLEDITGIYRENWVIKTLRGFSLLAGVAYFGIDSFNRLINNDSPVILVETAVISASLIAFSFALIPFNYRKVDTIRKWSLRTIDPASF
jgi:hypothetical protein